VTGHPDIGPGSGVIFSPDEQKWLQFSHPVQIIAAGQAGEVLEVIRRVEESVRRGGLYAAGFVSYEAAPAFDSALQVRTGQGIPLAWFGLYDRVGTLRMPPDDGGAVDSLEWNATVSRSDYEKALHEIKARIAAGITYQVNYTYRLRAPFRGDPWRYFQGLAGTARSGYPTYLDVGRWAVCSASPELFFRLDGDEVESRPMKGTAARGMVLKEDDERARTLQIGRASCRERVFFDV
jgi:para-aminobenzoate synthetase/4-amino-4-deoxychorismate lyase